MLAAFLLPATAECTGGTSVRFGDTVERIAQRCGVNVETLKQSNPGIGQRDLANGGFVAVPAPALPSPQIPLRGNGSRGRVTSPNITLK